MAIIIDLAQMREVLGSRPSRTTSECSGLPEGEVVLFTGVRYERYAGEYAYDSGAVAEALIHQQSVSKKK